MNTPPASARRTQAARLTGRSACAQAQAHLQQARELQLIAGVLDLGEAAQLPERLHVPVPHLQSSTKETGSATAQDWLSNKCTRRNM